MVSSTEAPQPADARRLFVLRSRVLDIWGAIMTARQRQADVRIAMYLRELPRELRHRLGIPAVPIEALRRRPDQQAQFSGGTVQSDRRKGSQECGCAGSSDEVLS
jgi:hypothetical protein